MPPVIYLDTSDYSAFGDVLRGVGRVENEALYLELLQRKTDGDAIFAFSSSILSELLQYDASFRETTLCKAQAVEALCENHAFIHPPRFLAHQIATAAHAEGLINLSPTDALLSTDGYWFPAMGDVFDDLESKIEEAKRGTITDFGPLNRKQRRTAKRTANKIDFESAAKAHAPELAAKYEMPEASIRDSFVGLFSGKITKAEAGRILFGGVATPISFVDFYFERNNGDKDMPSWMKEYGGTVMASMDSIRRFVADNPGAKIDEERLRKALTERVSSGRNFLQAAANDIAEFGIDEQVAERFFTDGNLALKVPSYRVWAEIVVPYFMTFSGFRTGTGQPKASDGGDFFHALFLPHCDLWRGDKAFGHLVKNAVPTLKERVVGRFELPARIDAWNKQNQTSSN